MTASPPDGDIMLRVRDLAKDYATTGTAAVQGVSFDVQRGQFFTLLGPSGCGKSTTLQCVAGLETPDAGEIRIADTPVFAAASRLNVPSSRRNISMMFQSYAIWPHMTVYENVAFPIRFGHRHLSKRVARGKVDDALELVHLEGMADTPAPFLSGGQQQRVALARALVAEPKLLLLDEPLSNLDAKLREDMRLELTVLLRHMGTSVLYVTHDQREAMSMSDRVAVMKDGRILQEGAPREIYDTPRDPFVARFVGRPNLIPGTVKTAAGAGHLSCVGTDLGEFECQNWSGLAAGTRCVLAVRPEAIMLGTLGQAFGRDNTTLGKVDVMSFLGDRVQYAIAVGDRELTAIADVSARFKVGDQVTLRLSPDRCFVIEESV